MRYMICLVILLACTGCTQAMLDATMAPSVNEARAMHTVTREAVDAHDANMSTQHTAMSPEAKDAIDESRAIMEARLAELDAKSEAIRSEALKNFTAIGLQMATKFAGLPAGSTISNAITSAVDGSGGINPESLLAMLGIGAASGGAGLYGGRGGKSRSAADIEVLKSKLDAMGSQPGATKRDG